MNRPATPVAIHTPDEDYEDYSVGEDEDYDTWTTVDQQSIVLSHTPLAPQAMSLLDELQESMPDGTYLQLANAMQRLHTRETDLTACIIGRGHMLTEFHHRSIQFQDLSNRLKNQCAALTVELRHARREALHNRRNKHRLATAIKSSGILVRFRFHAVLQELISKTDLVFPYDYCCHVCDGMEGTEHTEHTEQGVRQPGKAPQFQSDAVHFDHDIRS